MCEHCGCTITEKAHGHTHGHGHGHGRHHHHHDHPSREIEVMQSILSRNDRLAERNRGMFMAHHVTAINFMSSPGSGKTMLLEKTIEGLRGSAQCAVLVGDLATDNDAKRLQACGVPAIQISTGTTCPLDAHMIHHALEEIDLTTLDFLFIENVGNLVCPASFDLGEQSRVVILSVTEGEDKPLKYPVLFHQADVVLLTKTDLAEAVSFKRAEALKNIRTAAPHARILDVSAVTSEGMGAWMTVLMNMRQPVMVS